MNEYYLGWILKILGLLLNIKFAHWLWKEEVSDISFGCKYEVRNKEEKQEDYFDEK